MTMLDDRPTDGTDPVVERPSPWSSAALSSSAEIGRWRLAARLARREIRRRPWRTVLVVLLIGVPVAGMVIGDTAYRSSQLSEDQSTRFGAAAARLTTFGIFEGPHGEQVSRGSLDVDALLAQLPADVTSLSGAEVGFLPLRNAADPVIVRVDLTTLDLSDPLAAGIARPAIGRVAASADEVYLGRDVAAGFGVTVGAALRLVRPDQAFTVVGVGGEHDNGRLMNAPGFDISVLEHGVVEQMALLDGPSARRGILSSVPLDTGSDESVASVEYPYVPAVDHLGLFLGWLFCIMLMAVLGIVVSAAFAVSGRRQLVTIGQLSASGTDPAVLRRYLALQGTWSAALGVAVGVVGGFVAVPMLHRIIADDGRVSTSAIDVAMIGLTATAVGTVAAIVPTRQLARTSVLAALGGRRPVAPVRPRQVPIGAALAAGGLVALFLAVTSARTSNHTGSAPGAAAVMAGVGGLAVLAGMICLCPVVVDVVARIGSRRHGTVKLATRSLGRHRARSAALVAAVAAIGAASVAAGAAAEQEFANQRSAVSPGAPTDRVELTNYSTGVISEATRAQVEQVVGRVVWTESRSVSVPGSSGTPPFIVGDEAVLDAVGLSDELRLAIGAADAVFLDPWARLGSVATVAEEVGAGIEAHPVTFGPLDGVVVPFPSGDRQWAVVMPFAVERLGLTTTDGTVFGQLDRDVTRAEYDTLIGMNEFNDESAYFTGVTRSESLSLNVGYPDPDYTALIRLVILGGMLLLTVIVVAIGMALWAAEGKDERDALVSIGASPSVLARVAGIKAWLLAVVGGLIAVPLGFGTLRVAVAAAQQPATFPWLVAVGVVVVVPAVIGVASWACSSVAQRVRPVRMSTLATD